MQLEYYNLKPEIIVKENSIRIMLRGAYTNSEQPSLIQELWKLLHILYKLPYIKEGLHLEFLKIKATITKENIILDIIE